MAGGTLLPGRVDNQILSLYIFRTSTRFSTASSNSAGTGPISSPTSSGSPPSEYGQTPPLSVVGGYTVKGERGSRNTANEDALRELARIDFIQELEIVPGQQVSFRFRDLNTRAWLRDVGSALELYAYKACVDSAIFHDVISSAVVRWDEVLGHGSVSNEIDVMAARGVIPPVFKLQGLRHQDGGPERAGHPPGPLRRQGRQGGHRHHGGLQRRRPPPGRSAGHRRH